MSLSLKICLAIIFALALVALAFVSTRFARKLYSVKNPVSEEPKEEPKALPEPAPKLEEKTEEPVEEPAPEKAEEPVAPEEEKEPEPVEPEVIVKTEEVAVTAEDDEPLEDDEDDREFFGRNRTFAEKMLEMDVRTQEYYDDLNNEFISYRKMHQRISRRCVSYRFGRKLVAKISVRGKTMKLHLALPVSEFPEKTYFQKDMSEVKLYAETPFTVKVKSDRGERRALSLVTALCEREGIQKKTRSTPVDSMEEIRHLVLAELKKLQDKNVK